MEHATSFFDVYDFFGYFLPGGIVLITTIYAIEVFNLMTDIIKNLLSNVVYGSIVFLFSAYLLGHTLQLIGSFLEHHIIYTKNRFWKKDYPSNYLLGDGKKSYKNAFKTKLKEQIDSFFDLPATCENQIKFDLCYSLTIQKGIGRRVEKFLGMSNFFRGLYVSFIFSFILLSSIFYYTNTLAQFWYVLVILIILTALYFNRYLYFGKRFADSVYRDFYIYATTVGKKTESNK